MKTLICFARGHHSWINLGFEKWRCRTCGVWEDDSRVDSHFRIRRWLAARSPVWLALRCWSLKLHLRVPWIASLTATAAACDRQASRGPALEVDLYAWRLSAHAWIGGLWYVDEDCERRSLLGLTASVTTYGLAAHVCRLFGHKPEPIGEWVQCSRCEQTLQQPEREAKAAAA